MLFKRFQKTKKSKTERLTSLIAAILLLVVGAFLALCQLALLPVNNVGAHISFHSFLFFSPFAAAALFVSLPVYLGCAALLGGMLCARINALPMDFYELLFSNPMGAIMNMVMFALVIWAVLRGTRRLLKERFDTGAGKLILAAVLLLTSLLLHIFWFKYLNAIFSVYGLADALPMLIGELWSASFWAQTVFDWLVWLIAALGARAIVRKLTANETEPALSAVFQRWLFLVLACAFLLTTSIGFLVSSFQSLRDADETLTGQVNFVADQVKDRVQKGQSVEGLVETYSDSFIDAIGIAKNGEVISINKDEYSPTFHEDNFSEMVGVDELDFLQDSETMDIIYFKGKLLDDYRIVAFARSDRIFARRTSIILHNSLFYLVLFAAVFVSVSKLLNNIVVKGFKRTNATLALITEGDLEQRVDEHETREFSDLSNGINTTVDALKDLINEVARRMENDLATAKAIQKSALPRTFPPFPDVDDFGIYASMNAAKDVGGDFYDFFLVGEHTLAFLIADVSGKGISGALFMMAAKSELEHFMIEEGKNLAQAITSANKVLCANNDAGMFVTVWAATLDWETGELTYVNAGHNFPLIRHGKGGSWEWLKQKCGLFLGVFESANYRQETLFLEPGDELALYTDGVNEAFSVDGKEYGNDRLEAFLNDHCDERPEQLVNDLRADVATWAEGAEQSDDITIMALEYYGAQSE